MRIYLATLIILIAGLPFAAAQEAEAPIVFGRSYEDLKPEQTRLIDDWFKRFGEVMEREVDPAKEYNRVPVSYRTTFEAVTHALMTTGITSASGEKVEAAIDLVARLDAGADRFVDTQIEQRRSERRDHGIHIRRVIKTQMTETKYLIF